MHFTNPKSYGLAFALLIYPAYSLDDRGKTDILLPHAGLSPKVSVTFDSVEFASAGDSISSSSTALSPTDIRGGKAETLAISVVGGDERPSTLDLKSPGNCKQLTESLCGQCCDSFLGANDPAWESCHEHCYLHTELSGEH